MLKIITDQIIIILSFVLAFGLRIAMGHFPNESPLTFIAGYLVMLLVLCVFYLFLFWIMGYYERKAKRAVLEEILGVGAVITLGAVVLLTAMYLRKDLWVSRGIIFGFWVFATLGVSGLHILLNKKSRGGMAANQSVILDREVPLKNRDLKLGIIIVNKDNLGELKELLNSLKKAEIKCTSQIVVIDNASTDGSRQYLNGQKGIRLIANEVNVGYSRGVNQGLAVLKEADYYLALNPDIIVPKGAIESALNGMEEDQKIGLAGCRLLYPDGTLQYSARTFYSLRTILYRFTPLRGLLAGSSLEKEFLMMDWDHKTSREVDWVLGGCLLARREAVERVGTMDERFFMYFDDVDWCYRMWDKGLTVRFLADATMIHRHRRKSANAPFSRETREHIMSLLYYLWKYRFRLMPQNSPSRHEAG
ncbi:glycosyltransferase [Candidatus Saganbacteria bacterium]|nr:glycosyltransferase [Candidatus Saganbacteria bacterium]